MNHSKLLAAVAATCLIGPASARSCIGNWPGTQSEQWQRTQQYQHKALHLIGQAAIVNTVSYATNSVSTGVLASLAVGAGREIYKATQPNMRCEWSSMAFGAIGIALGAYTSNRWIIQPARGGVAIFYNATF